jgi:sugar O-acyltransferase (sialic acid O-acetyltransferase NeuD family)
MPIERINLIGAGGHAAVIIDALLKDGMPRGDIALWTEDVHEAGREVLGGPVAVLDLKAIAAEPFHVCVGDNMARARLYQMLVSAGAVARTIIHSDATVSAFATVGAGSFIAARAVVAPRVRLGLGNIVNHGAVIDHDCIIDDFCHLAPGCTLGGGVQVGAQVLIGAGANLLPSVAVGARTKVGAGAVVLDAIPAEAVFVGVPAARLVKE